MIIWFLGESNGVFLRMYNIIVNNLHHEIDKCSVTGYTSS